MKDDYLDYIEKSGFKDIKVVSESSYPVGTMFKDLKSVEEVMTSIKVSALKPTDNFKKRGSKK
jgi:hypothetical protein